MNAPAFALPTVSMQLESLRLQRQHEAVIRGRQMEAVAMWPVKDQLRLARQIVSDLHGYAQFPASARSAALIAMDAIDETETELGDVQ